MGGFLVIKLVKPTKVFCSWPPHQSGIGKILPSETQPDVGTAAAGVLGETNAAVGQELGGLDPVDRVFHELAEFLPLLVGNCSSQVLNLDHPLANEDDLGDFGNTGHPGVADELRIESQKAVWFFGVAARSGFPFQQTMGSV